MRTTAPQAHSTAALPHSSLPYTLPAAHLRTATAALPQSSPRGTSQALPSMTATAT